MRLITGKLGEGSEKSEESSAESIEDVVEANLHKNSSPMGLDEKDQQKEEFFDSEGYE